MSIEQTLERIAVALEKQNELIHLIAFKIVGVEKGPEVQSTTVVEPPKKAKKETAPKAPVLVAEPAESMFEPESKAAEITIHQLTEVLTAHASKLGAKVTIELIKRHGADQVTPKIATIPPTNYLACYNEVTADLKKLEGKK